MVRFFYNPHFRIPRKPQGGAKRSLKERQQTHQVIEPATTSACHGNAPYPGIPQIAHADLSISLILVPGIGVPGNVRIMVFQPITLKGVHISHDNVGLDTPAEKMVEPRISRDNQPARPVKLSTYIRLRPFLRRISAHYQQSLSINHGKILY